MKIWRYDIKIVYDTSKYEDFLIQSQVFLPIFWNSWHFHVTKKLIVSTYNR